MNKLIESYIKKINKNDIYNFALKNNITLNDSEIDLLYFHLKNSWYDLLYGNKEKILYEISQKMNQKTFEKCRSLFDIYLNKFQRFL